MQSSELELFFRFLGYGDIKTAKVWFIGIEAGGSLHPFQKDQSQIKIDNETLMYDETLPVAAYGTESRVWTCARDIAQFSVVGTDYFLGYMAPLPRQRETVLHTLIEQPEYVMKVRNEYIPRLYAAYRLLKPAAVVFHGQGAFRTYQVKKAFDLSNGQQPKTVRGIHVYGDRRIMVCGNFSRGTAFDNSHKQYVAEKLRAWVTD